MSKRRINQQQSARIKHIQDKRSQTIAGSGAEIKQGLVIAHYGKYTDVQTDGQLFHCKLRQNLGDIVVGDTVTFQLQQHYAVITALTPRTTQFWRLDDRGHEKLIAANVTQVFVVMAPAPAPSWLLLDSYLAALHYLNLPAVIVFNKMDLAAQDYNDYWQLYADLNIPLIKTCVNTGEGQTELIKAMQDQNSVFVGQSGVGKSSLIQALLPHETLTVGELHGPTGLGTHTTSTARLYQLSNGGTLIDSPGVRDFNLWRMNSQQLAQAFMEFDAYQGQCKFRNCTHSHEPHCAIQMALKSGKIALSRCQSYYTLLERFKE